MTAASKPTRLIALIALLLTVVGSTRAQDEPKAAAPRPEDVGSIDGMLKAMYDVISGPKGEARDWDRFRTLFAPGARMIPIRAPQNGPAQLKAFSPDEFIALVEPATKEDGFFESEIARTTQEFGHLAHVFSTYESRRAKDAEPFVRGINSVQLFNDGTRWWIVTIYWDSERPGQPIPDAFLPKK